MYFNLLTTIWLSFEETFKYFHVAMYSAVQVFRLLDASGNSIFYLDALLHVVHVHVSDAPVVRVNS